MKFEVHGKPFKRMLNEQDKRRIKAAKVLIIIGAVLFLILDIIAFIAHTAAGISVLLIILFLALLSYLSSKYKPDSYLELDDEIHFRNKGPWIRLSKGNYQYQDIAYLYLGDCPPCCIPIKARALDVNIYYTREEWRTMYGTYIVACNSANEPMFACRYHDEAWKILTLRCQNTAQIMTEAEHKEFLKLRTQIENETKAQNDYEKSVKKHEGYIN